MMKKLLIASLLVATASPALANKTATSEARIEDQYKTVIVQTPYTVEVCRDVRVSVDNKRMDTEGAIIGGIIGGIVGNQIGKGGGKDAATGVGAVAGAIIGGTKNDKEYRWENRCTKETRYKEETKTVYSHSIVTFWHEGQRIELKFNK